MVISQMVRNCFSVKKPKRSVKLLVTNDDNKTYDLPSSYANFQEDDVIIFQEYKYLVTKRTHNLMENTIYINVLLLANQNVRIGKNGPDAPPAGFRKVAK